MRTFAADEKRAMMWSKTVKGCTKRGNQDRINDSLDGAQNDGSVDSASSHFPAAQSPSSPMIGSADTHQTCDENHAVIDASLKSSGSEAL